MGKKQQQNTVGFFVYRDLGRIRFAHPYRSHRKMQTCSANALRFCYLLSFTKVFDF